MFRVVGVLDGTTITIDVEGKSVPIRLAGVNLVDAAAARTLLEWALGGGAWVLIEEQPGGGAFVYRSPDALFLNRELVLRGFADATRAGVEPDRRVPVTYLGQLRPNGPQVQAPQRRTSATRSGSGSGTSRRPPARRSRSPRAGGS